MIELALILVVVLVNLGLGFAVAVKAGRGPWSRHARRQSLLATPGAEFGANLSASLESGAAGPARHSAVPVEQLADELEAVECRLLDLQERLGDGSEPDNGHNSLLSEIRNGLRWIESLDLAHASPEYPDQATACLYTLQVVLETVAADLSRFGEDKPAAESDLSTSVTRVLMAYRDAAVVFNALRFAELPV